MLPIHPQFSTSKGHFFSDDSDVKKDYTQKLNFYFYTHFAIFWMKKISIFGPFLGFLLVNFEIKGKFS